MGLERDLRGNDTEKSLLGVLGRSLESFVSQNKPRFNLLFVYFGKLFHGLALFFGFCMRGLEGELGGLVVMRERFLHMVYPRCWN